MRFSVIARYSLSALIAAIIVCAAWIAIRRVRGRRLCRADAPALLLAGYLAALIQITALRVGLVTPAPFSGEVNLIPTAPLQRALALGAWPFAYNVLGNILWFLPLGLLLRGLGPHLGWPKALLVGAGVSAAIEVTQLILGTGTCDVDDVALNALGCLLGWALGGWIRRRFRRS